MPLKLHTPKVRTETVDTVKATKLTVNFHDKIIEMEYNLESSEGNVVQHDRVRIYMSEDFDNTFEQIDTELKNNPDVFAAIKTIMYERYEDQSGYTGDITVDK